MVFAAPLAIIPLVALDAATARRFCWSMVGFVVFAVLGGVTWHLLSSPAARQPPRLPTDGSVADSETVTTETENRKPTDSLPKPLEPEHGFVGSDACLACHPREHASWHKSYHRKMTQLATPKAVLAPFDDVTLVDSRGWPYHLQRRGDQFWIDMVDPDWLAKLHSRQITEQDRQHPARANKQIVMTTGSHHKQAFWVASSAGRFLFRIPWSYRLDDQRWIPLENDYLNPPGSGGGSVVWDMNCIRCHAVGGQPRRNDQTYWDAHVAELGIACEACHGPAAEHVRAHQDPKRAESFRKSGEPDPTIVNPANRSHERASQICGQCHSYSGSKDHEEFTRTGMRYRPGDDLHASRFIVRYSDKPTDPWITKLLKKDPFALDGSFWRDGTIRVSGRDYNGLLESACYQQGELSCLSCHSMHDYQQPDDQLGKQMHDNHACLQCHDSYGKRIDEHTHHPPGSSGSLCYNCHMPHTTYGLFKAIRSHRIDSPSVANSVRTGRPNACNLCHLDKTQSWTARHLSKWYGFQPVELDEDDRNVAASLLWLLRGDAVQRAIAAWHMGWQPARKTSGDNWLAPFLAYMLDDPYSAVRNVARRSLKKQPGFDDFDYDFLAADEKLSEAKRKVLHVWSRRKPISRQDVEQILIIDSGDINRKTVNRLRGKRDDRDVYIDE